MEKNICKEQMTCQPFPVTVSPRHSL